MNPPQVYEYEIEMTFYLRGEQKLITRTEYAYNLNEAFQQVCFKLGAEHGNDVADAKLTRIGPPLRIMQAYALVTGGKL